MASLSLLVVVHLSALLWSGAQDPPRAEACADWQECRQLALAAAERQDVETFHDLAWRAVQKGPKNDSVLMYLLARAQSASGRPSDAIVMLSRIADLRVMSDVTTLDDFRRVRALPGWADLERKIEAFRSGAPSPAAPTSTPTPKPVASAEPLAMAGGASAPAVMGTKGAVPGPATADGEALRFTASAGAPTALAYDAVSRRFLIADARSRKLDVVDEFSRHVATLSGLQAAFAEVAAIEIDPREGNLWVVSADAPTNPSPTTTLHKLQLISGRVLSAYPLPTELGPGRFVDVAVSPESTVLALDATGGRIMRLRPGASAVEVASTLRVSAPSSLAPAGNGLCFVVHPDGIDRVDLATGTSTRLTAASGLVLDGISRIRWYRGSLVAMQAAGDGHRAVRISLDRAGRRVVALDVLGPVSTAASTAAAIVGDTFYYLGTGEGAEVSVRRIRLLK